MVLRERASSCGVKIDAVERSRRHPAHFAAQAGRDRDVTGLAHQIQEIDEDVTGRDFAIAQFVPLAVSQADHAARRRYAQQIALKTAHIVAHAGDPVGIAVAPAGHKMIAPLHIGQGSPQGQPQLLQAGGNARQFIDRVRHIEREVSVITVPRDLWQIIKRRFAQRAHDCHHADLVGDILRLVYRTVLEGRCEILVRRSCHCRSSV